MRAQQGQLGRGEAGRVPPGPRLSASTGAGPSPAASWLLCLSLRAVPSGRQPRTQTPRRPRRGSGRPCSCGAAGGPARRPGAAGTSPPTPPTPASRSRSPRAAAPAASASPCSSTAPTASATPSASTSSRQDALSAGGRAWAPRAGAGAPRRMGVRADGRSQRGGLGATVRACWPCRPVACRTRFWVPPRPRCPGGRSSGAPSSTGLAQDNYATRSLLPRRPIGVTGTDQSHGSSHPKAS